MHFSHELKSELNSEWGISALHTLPFLLQVEC